MIEKTNNGQKNDGGGSFCERVYAVVSQIPRGKVSTYGRIAEALGSPRAARAVGTALHNNPTPILCPCHRVVNREGRLAPGFAFGGPDIQRMLLEAEGVAVDENGYVDLTLCLWRRSDASELKQ